MLDLFGRVPHRGEKRETGRHPGHGREGASARACVEVLVAPAPRPRPRGRRRRRDLRSGIILGSSLCLLATAFFSAAEMAFIAANRLRLRHLAEEGNATAARYLEAFRQPGAAAVHRDDGRDHRPHRRLLGGDLGAAAGAGRRGAARGHAQRSPRSCWCSARSSRRRWRASGRPASSRSCIVRSPGRARVLVPFVALRQRPGDAGPAGRGRPARQHAAVRLARGAEAPAQLEPGGGRRARRKPR